MSRPIFKMMCLALLCASLTACGDATPDATANGDVETARQASERAKMSASFDEVLAAGNKQVALSLGRTVMRRWPDSREAQRLKPVLGELESAVSAEAEKSRLAALWVYHRRGKEGDSAFIYRFGDGDASGGGRGLRLVLRDRPDWGRDIFLLVTRGRFDCSPSCQVELIADDQPPRMVDAFASEPDQNPALFFKDGAAFLQLLQSSRKLDIAAPLLDESDNRALFEVGGFELERWLGAAAVDEAVEPE